MFSHSLMCLNVFLGAVGSLSLLQPPPTRSQGNQILINSNSSSVYPMDCEPSLNMNQQRYLQHMHRSNRFNVPPLTLGSSYISQSQQKYAPTSLPLDLITATAAANNGNGSSSIMVLPSTATQDHLNKVSTGSSSRNNSNTSNNNADEMVCVQQSPVVIH